MIHYIVLLRFIVFLVCRSFFEASYDNQLKETLRSKNSSLSRLFHRWFNYKNPFRRVMMNSASAGLQFKFLALKEANSDSYKVVNQTTGQESEFLFSNTQMHIFR